MSLQNENIINQISYANEMIKEGSALVQKGYKIIETIQQEEASRQSTLTSEQEAGALSRKEEFELRKKMIEKFG